MLSVSVINLDDYANHSIFERILHLFEHKLDILIPQLLGNSVEYILLPYLFGDDFYHKGANRGLLANNQKLEQMADPFLLPILTLVLLIFEQDSVEVRFYFL